ncbi:MAG TPA: helix-turn-helix domain-containing protein [Pirellulaceae bacterium]|nr:helix-turn-helix domain-containing protein [Pirellulaceae bacterium]
MDDRELYRQILGVNEPWRVGRVELQRASGEVHIHLEHDPQTRWACPECGADCVLYDHQPERRWRHLDTCQFRTILDAQPPRNNGREHGPRVVRLLPWAESGSRFTARFEALAIAWLREASQQGVAELLSLSWDEVHGILERAVRRGLHRRRAEPVPVWVSTRRASASGIVFDRSQRSGPRCACCMWPRAASSRAWTPSGEP